MPIGLVLLFLMAVAPVLPWRKASGELLRDRLFVPGAGAGRSHSSSPFAARCRRGGVARSGSALAGFAAGAAFRQLVLATRRQGWRGLVGRANGGMVVHLGVILIAVALVSSNSYTRVGEFTLRQGTPVSFDGHTFELVDVRAFATDRSDGLAADISIDGGQVYSPAITRFTRMGQDVGTPSVRTGFTGDIYLTLEKAASADATEASVKIFIKPMIVWLWIGGALMAIGTILAAFPGRRRRPTAPVSEPAPIERPARAEGRAPVRGSGAERDGDQQHDDERELRPVEVVDV